MVNCCGLADDGEVTAGTDGDVVADNFVAKVLRVFLFEAEAVVFCVFVPLSEFDDEVDGLSLFYARYTEQGFNVYDTDTAKLDEVLGGLGCGSD